MKREIKVIIDIREELEGPLDHHTIGWMYEDKKGQKYGSYIRLYDDDINIIEEAAVLSIRQAISSMKKMKLFKIKRNKKKEN